MNPQPKLRAVNIGRTFPLGPIIQPDGQIVWPWYMDTVERQSVQVATIRLKPVDVELLDCILEQKTIQFNTQRVS